MIQSPFDPAPVRRASRIVLLIAWAAVAAFLIAQHAVWRDEVRALTLALAGADVVAMLRGVQGEGHPALWYLLLRAGHAIVGVPQILPGIAAAIGLSAAALFALKAPFRGAIVALILFGGFFLFEYTVVARNYGIAMLILFGLAALKPGGRGVVEGLLLALLANTSVPAVIFVGAYLLFRAVEVRTTGARWTPFLTSGVLATIGVLLCVVTVYPPVNDAAVAPRPDIMSVAAWASAVLRALGGIAPAHFTLVPDMLRDVPGIAGILTALLAMSALSLARTPGGLIAAVVALIGSTLFYGLVYPGSYRHHALYLVFLVALHWMAARGRGGMWDHGRHGSESVDRVARVGAWTFVALLALQVPIATGAVVRALRGEAYSQSANLAALLRRPDLRGAVVTGSPDYLLEPLHYHTRHPTWFVREQRFGTTVRYTRKIRPAIGLADVLSDAKRLRGATGRPVVIVLQTAPDPTAPASIVPDGYVTTFASDPAMARDFLNATRRLATLDRATTDERYTVYLLR